MKKIYRYLLVVLAIMLVAYHSVYVKKLSEIKQQAGENFDAAAFAKSLWNEKLPSALDSAVDLTTLIGKIEENPADAFSRYSHAMAIGNYRYSLVKLNGTVSAVHEDDIMVKISHADSLITVKLATEFIYGNAIRDASGLLDIKNFSNTADLNAISEELNKIVRTEVLPAFKKQVKQGNRIEATGAVEFNREHISFHNLELLPVQLKIAE